MGTRAVTQTLWYRWDCDECGAMVRVGPDEKGPAGWRWEKVPFGNGHLTAFLCPACPRDVGGVTDDAH